MRVVHVISSLDPQAGGTTMALKGLALAQSDSGLKVSVLATHRSNESPAASDAMVHAGISVCRVGPAFGRLMRTADLPAATRTAIAANDIVHIHGLWEEVQHQAAKAARRIGVPFVISPHGMLDPWSLGQSKWIKRAAMAWRVRSNLNHAAALHFTAGEERDRVKPLGLRAPAIVEPNGVDMDEFASPAESGSFRLQYPQIGDRFLVLFLSRIHPKKGLDQLIPAFARVIGAGPDKRSTGRDAVLVIAGPDADGHQKMVEDWARQHGILDRTVFTGMLHGKQRLAALADADLFVLPSYQENFGISVIEALAAGTPVVISDRINIHQQISGAGVGGVVPPQSAPLADEIAKWIDNGDLRFKASSKAASFVRENYDWKAIGRRWIGHYQRITNQTA